MCQYSNMFIIIDGYNLIRQSKTLRRYEVKSLEAGRAALFSLLSDYQKIKEHRITVVFDGWQGEQRFEERDRYYDVDIIYSGYGDYADDVIKRMIENAEEETIVVSSDREIISFAENYGKTALSSAEFEALMNKALHSSTTKQYAAADNQERERKKVGPSRRLSRAQKSRQKIMKRL
ncbi:MAG TPA: NYN domain-containing protein [Smithellaceae bacterium]|nr:NYN domain-containing protein [Smithellaceae bacterium]HRV27004.1 NYN domain-containing protein [Smithellaceae bacterium]